MDLVADRFEFLERLAESPAHKPRLEDDLDCSRSTIDRAIRRLEAAELVERTSEGYVATPTGRVAVDRYCEYLSDQHGVDAARAVLSSLPADCAVPTDLVVGGETVEAAESSGRAFERLGRRLRDANRYAAALPEVGDSRHLRLLHSRVTDGELSTRLLLDDDLVDRLAAEFPGLVADLVDAEGCSVRRADLPPYGLALVERNDGACSVLTAYDEGVLAGLVENESDRAVDCARTRLDTRGDGAATVEAPTPADDGVTPPVGGTTRDALAAASAVRLDDEYFTERTPGDPETAWRLGFDPVDVYYGYAVERTDPSVATGADGRKGDRRGTETTVGEGDAGSTGPPVSAVLADRLAGGGDHVVVGPPGSGKSTVCRQVACRWVRAGRGPVFYREAARDAGTDLDRLADVAKSAEGRALVVVEDAAEVTEAFLDLAGAVRDNPSVAVLGEARRGEWREAVESVADPRRRETARQRLATYEPPEVDEGTCRRAVETFEAATGREVSLSASALQDRVKTEDGVGELFVLGYQVVAHAVSEPWLDDPVGPSVLDGDVRDVYRRVAPGTGVEGPVADDTLALEVALLVATLTVAERPVTPGLVHAVAAARGSDDRASGDAHRAVEAVVGFLDGRMLLVRDDARTYRTQHPLWATRFLEHAVERAERETVAAFEQAVNAVLSLSDDADRRSSVETWLGRESPSVRRLADDGLDEFVTDLFGVGLDRAQLAPLFGTSEHSGIELPEACPTGARLEARSCRGNMWYDHGDTERAETELSALVERAESADEDARTLYLAEGNWSLGELVVDRGETERAREYLRAALGAARKGDHRKREVGALNSLAWVAMTDDEYDRARDRLEEALDVAEDLGVCGAHSDTLYYFARLEQFQGNLEAAEEWLERTVEMDRELGMRYSISASTKLIADLALLRGATDRAEEYYRRSLELAREVGDSQGIAHTLFESGKLALQQGRVEEASDAFERSLELAREYEMRRHEGFVHAGLGRLAVERGALDEAETRFREARSIHEDLDNQRGLGRVAEGFGDLTRERDQHERARERYRESVERYDEAGADGDKLEALEKLVDACRADGDDEAAREWYERGAELAADLGRDEWGDDAGETDGATVVDGADARGE
jgi:tetratricopeptide (TPR) repeat protein